MNTQSSQKNKLMYSFGSHVFMISDSSFDWLREYGAFDWIMFSRPSYKKCQIVALEEITDYSDWLK